MRDTPRARSKDASQIDIEKQMIVRYTEVREVMSPKATG